MMYQIRQIFGKNPVIKNIGTLISGTAIAQIILIGFQLILRRLFDPEVFGAFAIYVSIVGVMVILSTLRYEMAIVLPKEERKANSIVAGGMLISFTVNLVFLILLAFFADKLVNLVNFPADYKNWLYFLPASAFLLSTYQLINYWLTRKGGFKAISINKIARRLSEGSTQSVFGYIKFEFGLIIGEIVGNFANVCAGFFQAGQKGFTFKNVSFRKIKSSLKRYKGFPKYQAFPALLNTASLMLPIIFISRFYSPENTGYFDLSKQILSIPIALITVSVSQVMLKEFSDRVKNGMKLKSYMLKTAGLLSVLILPFMLIIIIFGESLFAFVFSDIWSESGYYAAILIPAYAIQFVVSPLSVSFSVLEKLKTLALWQFFYFVSIASLFLIRDLPIDKFLMIFTCVNIVAYLVYFTMIILICKKYDFSLKR